MSWEPTGKPHEGAAAGLAALQGGLESSRHHQGLSSLSQEKPSATPGHRSPRSQLRAHVPWLLTWVPNACCAFSSSARGCREAGGSLAGLGAHHPVLSAMVAEG